MLGDMRRRINTHKTVTMGPLRLFLMAVDFFTSLSLFEPKGEQTTVCKCCDVAGHSICSFTQASWSTGQLRHDANLQIRGIQEILY